MAALYNRYVPGSGGYTRVVMDDDRNGGGEERPRHQRGLDGNADPSKTYAGTERQRKSVSPPFGIFGGEEKNAGIAGILKSLHLEDLDSGDILLLLIILFVFLEGDNIELVITLGLMLLLGLGDERKENQKE